MTLKKIEKAHWTEFFTDFSKEHQDWLVDISEYEKNSGSKGIIKGLPLKGITPEFKIDPATISIFLGNGHTHLTHYLHNPQEIELDEPEPNLHRQLTIYSENGQRTIIKFISPVYPETVNDFSVE